MRQLQQLFSKEMLRSTTVAGLVLGLGSLMALGAVCTKVASNPNTANVNANAQENTNIVASTNQNSNQNTNSETNTNSTEIDTSDWLTYTNEEYGFSLNYPSDWLLQENGKYVNFFSPERSEEATTDLTSSADLYLSVEINSGEQPISEVYKDKSEFTILSNGQNKVIIRFEEMNDYANSIALHYYLQNVSQNKVISLTFFKENKLKEIIKRIIDTIVFNS